MSSLDVNSAVKLLNESSRDRNTNFDVSTITNAFRYLRNLCGTNPEAQDTITRELNVSTGTKKILLSILTCNNATQEELLCLQVGLQFLGNLIVGNKNNQKQLWSSSQDLLEACLRFYDAKVKNISAMILYNIFLGNPELLAELKHPFEELYDLTLNETASEFAVFILEIFALKSNYVVRFYNELKPEKKLMILEIIKNIISEQKKHELKPEIIQFFSKQFTSKSDLILKTSDKFANSVDPVEVLKILDLLVAFSSDDKQSYLSFLQKEQSLLINCVELLKNVHSVSKEGENNFSMITKISEIEDHEKMTSVQENPVFGFKCSLIRLIGNMCWKNTVNQNQVRELDCIPVLLDCCNIDARNPFIIQWCILAIRNVCEKNSENQQVIASLSKEGKIDSVRLQELGITFNVNSSGESLCIAPLK